MSAESNKQAVVRFNTEVIERGDRKAFDELVAPGFVNRSAPPGAANDGESMWNTFQKVLHPGLSQLRVEIHDQIAEGDRVTTRKTVSGIHTGPLLGIAPTGQTVAIEVIDIVRIMDGRYAEHWGINTLPTALARLKESQG